jgi:DNA replication protein DnaC
VITVIYGPPGSGKTFNSAFLKGKYAAKRIVDEWDGQHTGELKDHDLVLTQRAPDAWTPTETATGVPLKYIHIAEALRR